MKVSAAGQTLEVLRTLPPAALVDTQQERSAEAIAAARIAYGSNSRRAQNFVRDMRTALSPELRAAEAAHAEAPQISSQPTAEEAAGASANLEAMTGLTNAKRGLRSVLAQVELNQIHEREDIAPLSTSTNLVFAGPPGAGKTTAARLFAHAMKHAGAVRTGQLVEVSRSDLVGGFIGQTEAKTRAALESARGGVLFVDEAYTLLGEGQDFGLLALNEILSFMENNRGDICVIFAGYRDDIERLLNHNEGLRSRFNEHITFDPYSVEELREIFRGDARRKGPYLVEDAVLRQVIPQCLPPLNARGFANARDVRILLDRAIGFRSMRLKARYLDHGRPIPRVDLQTLIREDFRAQ